MAIVIAALVLGGLVGSRAPSLAQFTGPSLPSNCSSGEVVVSDGLDRFRCVRSSELLRLTGCREGDLVTADGNGGLRCGRPGESYRGGVMTIDGSGHPSRVDGPRVEDGERVEEGVVPGCPEGGRLVWRGGRWECAPR